MKKLALLGLTAVVAICGMVEERLQEGPFTKAGTFTRYDFAGVESAFDWVFVTSDGSVYQLQGNEPSENDVFGWKKVYVTPAIDENSWNMIYLGDYDHDGNTKFDWVLYQNRQSTEQIYKLAGVTRQGTFEYQKIEGLTASLNENTVRFIAKSVNDWNVGQKLAKLKVEAPGDLKGVRLQTNFVRFPYGGVTQQITIDFFCDGSFHYRSEIRSAQYDRITEINGSDIAIEYGSIYLHGIDQDGNEAEEYAYAISGDGYLYANKSCYNMSYPDEEGTKCPDSAYLETILVRELCH